MFRSKALPVVFLMLAVTVSSSAWAQQYARPDETTSTGAWTAVNAGSLHAAVNEATADNNNYIDSGNNNTTATLGLSNVTDPGTYANNHILRYQCQSTGGGGSPERCNAALYDGATLIFDTGNVSATRGAFGLEEFTIPDASASGVPDYTNLNIQLTSANLGGGESIQISWVELEVPGAAATAPFVTTNAATGVTQNQATLGGTVSSDGNDTVTDVGVYWIADPGVAEDGTKQSMTVPSPITDPFSGDVTGLSPNTTYNFKAYATNSVGETIASNELSFTTLAGLATVATRPVENITATTADLGGDVTNDGGTTVTERGIVWDTSTPPETGGTLVPMGSETGPFIGTVDSLPTDTLVYFRAYADNTAGRAYSAIQSFTPVDSPITFDRVSGRSMQIFWPPSAGDGSIVVIREQTTPKVDPVDGVDYAGQPDYSLAPEIGSSGNFVVYKGPNTYVWVTGLALNTLYSIAIYDYTGSGASTDYDQLNPLEAEKATTNLPQHNLDNRLYCDACHNAHGAFLPRDAELKTVCSSCHSNGGPAAAKQEFDNHVTPTKNPDVDYVDCGYCHEIHRQGVTNTTESLHSIDLVTRTNKSFLRANVDKYITTAQTPAYLHTDQPQRVDPHPDAPQAANNPDRAVEGGNDTTARGYCQVCHSMTDNHRSSNTAGADQCHDGSGGSGNCGPAETHCGTCHEHNNQFAPTNDCTVCHANQQGSIPRPIITTQFDRTSSHITAGSGAVVQADCEVCHDQTGHPGDQIVGLKDADGSATLFEQLTAGAPTTNTGEGERFEGACMSCHADQVASGLPADSGAPTTGQTRSSPFTNSPVPPLIDSTLWGNSAHDRPTGGTAPVTCVGDGTNGCHGSGHGSDQNNLLAPADNSGTTNHPTEFCVACHDGSLPPAADVFTQFTGSPNQRYTAGSAYETVNKRHDVLERSTPAGLDDQTYSSSAVTCKNCHNPHAENIDGSPSFRSNPDDQTTNLGTYDPLKTWTGDSSTFTYSYAPGTDLDPTNPRGYTHTGLPPDAFTPTGNPQIEEPDFVEFCLTCHDGTAPAGVTLPPPAAGMINIAEAYAGDQHGAGPGSDNAARGWMKYPWATPQMDDPAGPIQPAPYAALNCTLCHGHHGSENIYNLKSSVTVAGEVMNVGATNAWENEQGRDPDGAGPLPPDPAVYFLPGYDTDTQEMFGWGAWCTFCHEVSHDTNDGTGCSSGHMHGGNNF